MCVQVRMYAYRYLRTGMGSDTVCARAVVQVLASSNNVGIFGDVLNVITATLRDIELSWLLGKLLSSQVPVWYNCYTVTRSRCKATSDRGFKGRTLDRLFSVSANSLTLALFKAALIMRSFQTCARALTIFTRRKPKWDVLCESATALLPWSQPTDE